MRPNRSEGWIAQASERLNVTLRHHSHGEACGPCPQCGGKDRLIAFAEGNHWCRRCEYKGWWIDNPDEGRRAIAEERVQREKEQAASRQKMAECQDWISYHAALLRGPELLDVWGKHGMGPDEIRKWGLGCCESCPMVPDYPSLTIPCFQEGVLLDIRHRLIGAPEEMGKYRSHLPGLVPPIFNLDGAGLGKSVIVVEGEKKAIILDKFGFHGAVGLPGLNFAKYLLKELPDRLNGTHRVAVMLDPHTNSRGEKLAGELIEVGVKALVADCFMKPDDFLLAFGAEAMRTILKQARRV